VPNVPYTKVYTLQNLSADPDGDPLAFGWSFTSIPAGSAAVLSSTTAPTPTFTPDKEGPYVVRLVVTDGPTGAPNRYTVETQVTIHARNLDPTPTASAAGATCSTVGAELRCSRNNPVRISATVADADGDTLECAWRVTEPGAAAPTVLADFAACANPSSAVRDYTPAGEGTYVVEYVVRDHDRTTGTIVHTVAAAATFVSKNDPPVPVLSRPIYYGNMGPAGGTTLPVTLDASASTDPNLDHLGTPGLSYFWQMMSASTPGDLPALVGADTARPSFVPLRVADYVLEVRVSDPAQFGRPAASTTVQVTVHVDRYVKELGHTVSDAARAQDLDRFVLAGKDPADPTKGMIWVWDAGVEGIGIRLVDPVDGTSSGLPRLVDVTPDGTRAVVVDEGVSIWIVNLGTRTMQRVSRPFAIRDLVVAGNKFAYLFGSGSYDTARELDVTSGTIGIPGGWPGYGWFGAAYHNSANTNANQIYRVDGSSHYWYRTQLNSGSGATGYDVSKAAPDCGGYPLTYATAVWATQDATDFVNNAYLISSCGRVYRADTLDSLGTTLAVTPSHVDSTSTGAILVTESAKLTRFSRTLTVDGTDTLPIWSLNGAGLTASASKAFFDLNGTKRIAVVSDTATPARYGIVTFP
jgi:hypothetical protein